MPEPGLADELRDGMRRGIEKIRTQPTAIGKWIGIVLAVLVVSIGSLLVLANATDDTRRTVAKPSTPAPTVVHAESSDSVAMRAPPVASVASVTRVDADFEFAADSSTTPHSSAKHHRARRPARRGAGRTP